MESNERRASGLPMIVKFVEHARNGVQSHTFSRYAIGYIVRGTKFIHNGDKRQTISKGDVFYLGIGTHYTEEVPDETNVFEQILFYYQPEDLHKILMYLNLTYGLNISYNHSCPECMGANMVSMPAWQLLKGFFSNTANYLRSEGYLHDETAENIKMTELVYLLVSHEDCCLRSKIIGNIDTAKESFEQLMYNHIFEDVSIEQLSMRCNRSLTSFKKEFKRIFLMPPHQWFIRQRLMHARMLLISTSRSVSQIGTECAFPNTSHFIKLFKKEYNMTPASYRSRHNAKLKHARPSVESAS
jgi:AraC-like DNA-binding protein